MSYYDDFEAPYELYEKWTKGAKKMPPNMSKQKTPLMSEPCKHWKNIPLNSSQQFCITIQSCPYCRIEKLSADLAEAVAALREIAKPCYLILGPAYADPHNVKAICDGMNARIGIATAVLVKLDGR